MAFGQSAGPPASAAQITELTELLARAGFDGFLRKPVTGAMLAQALEARLQPQR